MIGKVLKVNDYKFTYGQDTAFINVYGVFKYLENGNKYAVYSYKNGNKLFYGAFFKRKNEAVIMSAKENPKDIINKFVDSLLNESKNSDFEIVSLDGIESVQIIDEYSMDKVYDINKLYDLTIPKPVVEDSSFTDVKKPKSIAAFFFMLLIAVIVAFFMANPEVLVGENKIYSCTKSYLHDKLPASVNEEILLIFNGQGKISEINLTTDYIFTDIDYFEEFKEKSYYYQYMKEGDTYKLINEAYTYRLFSKVDINDDYFLPVIEFELIDHYESNNYICKVVESDEK